MPIDYRSGEGAISVDAFIALARRIWDREYDAALTDAALRTTINVGGWDGDRFDSTDAKVELLRR